MSDNIYEWILSMLIEIECWCMGLIEALESMQCRLLMVMRILVRYEIVMRL